MNKEKLEKAKQYLRDRKIYITEFNFKPTNAAGTNVAVTIARYRSQVINKNKPLMQVKL